MNGAGNGRKPRIALMGEFSAGKSTLSNLLMGVRPLPEKVTATRLSPVWIRYGNDAPYRVDVDGTVEAIELARLEEVPVDETRYVSLSIESDILEICDLIDFPGISDPNMASTVWERMLSEVDGVIWCTHANQAWRQSEAAVWETMPETVRENSILLITRYDKLINERDRSRVFKRVSRETAGMFSGVFPISLLQAIQAGEDMERWNASGAGPFTEKLIEMIERLTKLTEHTDQGLYNFKSTAEIPRPVATPVMPRRVQRQSDDDASGRPTRTQVESSDGGTKVQYTDLRRT